MPPPSSSDSQNELMDSQKEQIEVQRLQLDFDFVLQLGDPNYIRNLQQRDYFSDPNFLYYLNYLLYWQKPEFLSILVGVKEPKCINIIKKTIQ